MLALRILGGGALAFFRRPAPGDRLMPCVSAVAWTALGMTEEAWLQVFHETKLQHEEMSAIQMA